MKTGIYKILNKVNGKFYIGSAVDIMQRWRHHKHHLRQNKHHNIYLQRAWNKYWEQSFEFSILEECSSDTLLIQEQLWLDNTKAYEFNIGYNLTPTAGNSKGVKHNEETRKRMSLAKRQMTQETKMLMSTIRKGKLLSEEHKANISEGLKDRVCSEETKIKISIAHKGRVLSDERKAQISKQNTGKKRGKYKKKYDPIFDNMSAPPKYSY